MKLHWKILIWLIAGVIVGGLFQVFLETRPSSGVKVEDTPEGVRIASVAGKVPLKPGDGLTGLIFYRGTAREQQVPIASAAEYEAAIATAKNGDVVWYQIGDGRPKPVTIGIDPDSQLALWIRPFSFLADIFLRLLKMLIVPIILTSIIAGVISVGAGADLRRLGVKTFGYYIATSMIAILTGLIYVNAIRPGVGAPLGLQADDSFAQVQETSFIDVLIRMVPENIFEAFGDNVNMLQVIFFALLFGYCILRVREQSQQVMKSFFESAFDVMMTLAELVLSLIPYGVFCLLVKVVATTGFDIFRPLGIYMITVLLALFTHLFVTLPLILWFGARVNPWRWIKAMSPAMITAFSTSSSSMTLPVTLETVEKRGKVSNRITSFVQPLGATINMDGTALYECVGVIFLAQYYASVSGYHMSFEGQVLVVIMALLASIGAAGIPSAGLIMMVTILSALNLPVEGAALLLAIDRPLDMVRTVVNVFSDTCGSAVIAKSEGETALFEAGT